MASQAGSRPEVLAGGGQVGLPDLAPRLQAVQSFQRGKVVQPVGHRFIAVDREASDHQGPRTGHGRQSFPAHQPRPKEYEHQHRAGGEDGHGAAARQGHQRGEDGQSQSDDPQSGGHLAPAGPGVAP